MHTSRPGSGRKAPPATPEDQHFPAATAQRMATILGLDAAIPTCRACPRLVAWREEVGQVKRRAFRDWHYWARPVPGYGPPDAPLAIVGLAPAAHGGNRTGRIFTGDRSGDFLFAALHRAGFANRPVSLERDDGLRLGDCYVAAVARCAPPGNRPLPKEMANCREYLEREWALLTRVRVVLALGRVAMDGFLAMLREIGRVPPRRRYAFGHGVAHDLGAGLTLYASYHPSQQNTFTGKLTAADMDGVLAAINRKLGRAPVWRRT
jgi:uracil-DNA glycosylase